MSLSVLGRTVLLVWNPHVDLVYVTSRSPHVKSMLKTMIIHLLSIVADLWREERSQFSFPQVGFASAIIKIRPKHGICCRPSVLPNAEHVE